MNPVSHMLRRSFVAIGVLCMLLFVLTIAVPDWLEAFGFEPDGGNGSAEALIAFGFAIGTLLFGGLALLSSRRLSAGLVPREVE